MCSDGDCMNVEGEYRPLCQVCDKKKPRAEYTIDPDVCVCDVCWNNEPISLTP